MKGGIRAATALGIGYLLGRRRELRTATLMAAATAVGGTDVGGLVLRRGMKMLGSTEVLSKVAPQFGELAETVRGDLVTAGKAAATAAVSNRVDSLTDSLHDRAERLRNPGAAVAEGAGEAAETAGRAASGGARRATSTVGGTARRMTGRRGAGTAEPEDEDYRDDEDLPEEEVDEAEDYEGGEPDEYEADEPDEEVRVVRHGDLAALVSDIDPDKPLGRPDDLIAHEELLDSSWHATGAAGSSSG